MKIGCGLCQRHGQIVYQEDNSTIQHIQHFGQDLLLEEGIHKGELHQIQKGGQARV